MKKYQLVLQFPVANIADFDQFVAFEDSLIKYLPASNKVDGHDCGTDEFNIFILTDEPDQTLNAADKIRLSSSTVQRPIAAYRSVRGEDYVVLWPPEYKGFSIS
jgi:hypothetical protein